MNTPLTIPPPDQLRADIRARAAELRALRKLLRLAEAAEDVRSARRERGATPADKQQGVAGA